MRSRANIRGQKYLYKSGTIKQRKPVRCPDGFADAEALGIPSSAGHREGCGGTIIRTIIERNLYSMEEKLQPFESKMSKSYDVLLQDYASIRAGRANPHVLDKIKVDYYGTPTPLQQVGNISVPEARIILIQPWEKKMIKEIEKAIMTSDLGINPTNDGSAIRLVFPELTEERRKVLSKDVKKKGDDAKVAIRNIRRDANETFKKQNKNNELTEDDQKLLETKIQKLTDKYIEQIDKAIEEKTKEIMTV